jgi:hypothetical protein
MGSFFCGQRIKKPAPTTEQAFVLCDKLKITFRIF